MKFLDDVCDKEDLKYYVNEQDRYNSKGKDYCIELEWYSDLGEDCIISLIVPKLTKEEIRNAMYSYYENFDAEEHACELYNLRGEHDTPTSIRSLLADADKQEEKLMSIYNTMLKIK